MSVLCFTTGAFCRTSVLAAEPALGQKLQYNEIHSGGIDLYIPEFSKPTGRYVSRLFLRIFNASLRRGSLVFAGNPCTPGMSVMTREDEPQVRAALKQNGIKTVVCNFWNTSDIADGIVFQAEPFMLLKIQPEWKNAEGYKQSMHSKYRVRVNKALQCSRHLTSDWLNGNELTENQIESMSELLSATLANKTLALPPDLKGLIKGFCREYGNDYKTVFCSKNGEIMGFLSAVRTGNRVFAMHIGYRAEHAREWHLYQRLMLDLIEKCIDTGVCEIQLGRTATEIKSTLGAEPQENSIVIFTKSILLRLILKGYKRFFFKPKTYILRRPFREQ